MNKTLRFYLRQARFGFAEQFSDWGAALGQMLVLPFYVFILTKMWQRFTPLDAASWPGSTLIAYFGMTEILFITFVRSAIFTRASADFSLGLVRPRSWLGMHGAMSFGRILGHRALLGLLLIPCCFALGFTAAETFTMTMHLALLLPALTIIAALYNLIIANLQILWHQTSYMTLAFTKIFLVFGGVFGPIDGFSEPGRSWLLALPPSDIFFQAAHFCVRGTFVGLTSREWLVRCTVHALILILVNVWLHRIARRHHLSWGG